MRTVSVQFKPTYIGPECINFAEINIRIGPAKITESLEELEKVVCQVKEMLEAQAVRQKIWEAREANLVDQLEQEHSIPNNDPKLPEKEQSQRTRKANKKQYIMSYPDGYQRDVNTNQIVTHAELAVHLLDELEAGRNIYILDTWKVQVIDL